MIPAALRFRTAVALAAAAAACAHAPGRQAREGDRVEAGTAIVLRYGPQDDAVARQVRRALRLALPVAERWGALPSPLTVTIHPTHEALELAARRPDHPWLRAWARVDAIELQSPRTWSRGEASDAELARLLAHELTHCAMFQAIGGDSRLGRAIPVWFREGMATVSAGERFAAATPQRDDAVMVAALHSTADAPLAYAAASRAFRFLLEAHGEARVHEVLTRMRRGAPFADAFRQAVGTSVEAFEADFRAHLGEKRARS